MALRAFAEGFGRTEEPAPPPCPPGCRPCNTDLPSVLYAERLVDGDLSALVPVVVWTAARAGLVGLGMYAAGARGPIVFRAAVVGSLAIEAFVLATAAADRDRRVR